MAVPFSNTKVRIPHGFQNLLEGMAREVLRAQPKDVCAFAAVYFESLLDMREKTGYDPVENGARLQDRMYNNKAFGKSGIQPGNVEQEDAALKIQTKYRQFSAKQEVQEMRQDNAAVRIQAGYRGYLDRQKVKASRESRGLTQSEGFSEAAMEEEDAYVDPEKLAAASVIQSGMRGFASRQNIRTKQTSGTDAVASGGVGDGEEGGVEASYTEDDSERTVLDMSDPETLEAALKIQAGLTGFKIRQEMSNLSQIGNEVAEEGEEQQQAEDDEQVPDDQAVTDSLQEQQMDENQVDDPPRRVYVGGGAPAASDEDETGGLFGGDSGAEEEANVEVGGDLFGDDNSFAPADKQPSAEAEPADLDLGGDLFGEDDAPAHKQPSAEAADEAATTSEETGGESVEKPNDESVEDIPVDASINAGEETTADEQPLSNQDQQPEETPREADADDRELVALEETPREPELVEETPREAAVEETEPVELTEPAVEEPVQPVEEVAESAAVESETPRGPAEDEAAAVEETPREPTEETSGDAVNETEIGETPREDEVTESME